MIIISRHHRWLRRGQRKQISSRLLTGAWRVGMIICYEICFPHAARCVARQGNRGAVLGLGVVDVAAGGDGTP